MKKIKITTEWIALEARLNESHTANEIWEILPIVGSANVWGEEIYFEIPLDVPQEDDARQEMEIGELGYWPAGRAFCIFFGPTPVSTRDRPRAYSPVNPLGNIIGDVTSLRSVQDGNKVTISRI